MLLVFLLACPNGKDSDSETAEPAGLWHLDAAQLGDSMLLGAWEHQGELLIVGGNLTDGGGDLLRWDGSTLCREDDITEHALWWVHSDGEHLVMVGESGTVLFDGERRDVPTSSTLFGAWVDGEELLVVGGDVNEGTGAVWRWAGDAWEPLVQDAPGLVFKVYEDLIVGDGVAWTRQGSTLTAVANSERLVTIHNGVVVGGSQGPVVMDWDGASFTPRDTTWLGQPVNGVHNNADGTWVSGMFGVMGSWEDGAWSIPDFPLTSEHFHAARRFGSETWFIGGNFLSGGSYGTIGRHGEGERNLSLSECSATR